MPAPSETIRGFSGDAGASAPAAPSPGNHSDAAIGHAAPDFKLEGLEGANVELAHLQRRVIVLEFGSLTAPSFRDRAAAMERLYQQEQLRAVFFIIYTREAHPSDGWEVQRNKAANIDVEQPKDMAGRKELARRAKQMLSITIPIAMDTMDDAVAAAYDGMPNVALVIGRDHHIAGRQRWTDPSGLKRLIDDAAAQPNTQPAAVKP